MKKGEMQYLALGSAELLSSHRLSSVDKLFRAYR